MPYAVEKCNNPDEVLACKPLDKKRRRHATNKKGRGTTHADKSAHFQANKFPVREESLFSPSFFRAIYHAKSGSGYSRQNVSLCRRRSSILNPFILAPR